MTTKEIWKEYKLGLFISNLGRFARKYNDKQTAGIDCYIKCDDKKVRVFIKTPHLNIKPTQRHSGYLVVGIYSKGKTINKYIHRMVAETFIPNPDNLPTVNHKDGNHLNNTVLNLEWMTYADNNKHAIDNGLNKRRNKNEGKHISCYSTDGILINSYTSMRAAERDNKLANGSVSMAIKHKWLYGGRFWSKEDNLTPEQVSFLVEKNKRDNAYYSNKGGKVAVDQYDKNGNLIATYRSCADAAKQFNGQGSFISRVINGERKTYKGFIWKRH